MASASTRERYLEAVADVQRLVLARQSGMHFSELLPILGRATTADRCYFVDVLINHDGRELGYIRQEWCRPGIPRDDDSPEFNGFDLKEGDPELHEELSRGTVCVRSMRNAVGLTRMFMEMTGVQTLLLLPVRIGDRLRGVFGFDNCGTEDAWNDDAINLLRTAADAASVEIARRNADEQLNSAMQRLRLHMELSPMAVIEWDDQFNVVQWSRRAEQIFEWKAAEVLGRRWADFHFVHDDDLPIITQIANQLLDGSRPYTVTSNRNYTKSGRVIHCEWYTSVIRGGDGRTISILSLALDVTERRIADEEVRQALERSAHAEKMAALGKMASGVAHDFNNALTVIIGKSDLLLTKYSLPERARALVTEIMTSGLDAATTVRRMQEFVRTSTANPGDVVVDLPAIARQVIELTRQRWSDQSQWQGSSIELVTDLPPTIAVRGNAAEIREVLTNLIFNAVDAMPNGGTLHVSAGIEGERAWLRVTDTGVGMDAETRRRCFEPFFTTKGVEGTGLGLSVSWSIARRLGGELTVESEIGRGSTMTLWLQVSTATSATALPMPRQKCPPKKVLIIDDRPDVIATIAELLLLMKHFPQAAIDGMEGLAYLEQGSFDLVITDLGMPKMDGREVARRVKAIAPQTPVVLLTGWADELEVTGVRPEFVDRIVAKPVTLMQLAAVMDDLFPFEQ